MLRLRIDCRDRAFTARRDIANFAVRAEREPVNVITDGDRGDLAWPSAGDIVDMDFVMIDIAFPHFFLIRSNPESVAATGNGPMLFAQFRKNSVDHAP